ncbi:CDT1 domain-containing protein [Cephalotus follicularis]|uniref:CDT1 domain-containing protein n=1 Tax=Cephalotus follicularis TaxID=3775 RepID=A0A1Q3DCK3_CEPFO|nr:CDT1 domain-containing protein [Cephalotus follicularis]
MRSHYSTGTPQSTPVKSGKEPLIHNESPSPSLTTQTPDKHHPSPPHPRRTRSGGVALSVAQVRKAAQCRPQQAQIKTAIKQILSRPAQAQIHKPQNVATKLPQSFEMLGEFFDSLESSIRLLRLKGSMTTFTNISPKIQCLTDRRFSYQKLGQLKYILPEAIEIKKVLIFDERTSCMKSDLHVTLDVDAIHCDPKSKSNSENKNLYLRKLFGHRLLEFHKAHPQIDEVPEEMLPEPFNQSQQDGHTHIITSPSMPFAEETSTGALENEQPVVASLLPRSFRTHFSKKIRNVEVETWDTKSLEVSAQTSIPPVPMPRLNQISSNVELSSAAPSPLKWSLKRTSSCASPSHLSIFHCPTMISTCLPATPIKDRGDMKNKDGSPTKIDTIQTTPAKLVLTPARPMTATPALHPPKRSYMSPDGDSISTPIKLVRRPPRSRSLKFDTPVKNKKFVDEVSKMEGGLVDDDDDILPEDLLESIREKERRAIEERDPAISQAKRRRQMIAFLPKLFNMIHFLFQSIKRSIITKEELIHKIIASHCDLVDRKEVEEQLNLLLELVPEWISEKLASGGDLLVCINKMSSVESIRIRLAEAK